MKRFEVPPGQVAQFLAQNAQLTEAKRLKSEGEKKDKAAKDFVRKWLLEQRQVIVDTLPVGEIIIIQIPAAGGMKDCFKVERKNSGNRLQVTRLQNEKPEIAAEFTGPTPATYIDPCPQA
jgi:hypothetical protein